MWVARSASLGTRCKYRAQAARFLAFVNRPLAAVRLGNMQSDSGGVQHGEPEKALTTVD
jgi:hypothetical protein